LVLNPGPIRPHAALTIIEDRAAFKEKIANVVERI